MAAETGPSPAADPEEMSEKPSSSALRNAVVPAAVVLGTVVLAILIILLLYGPLDLPGWSGGPNTNYLVLLLVPAALALVVYWLERALGVAWQKVRRKAEPQAKPRKAWPRWSGLRGKTAWNWLELLIVPLVVAAIGFWFAAQQDARQLQIEAQRAQDLVLQGYLDQMSTLVLEDLSEPKVQTLLQARTLTALRRLNASRKTEVMQYLVEAELVQRVKGREPIIGLGGADLNGVSLSSADLNKADLSNADLSNANLRYANLSRADLGEADLSEADLSEVDLYNANLSGADLSEADLTFADLSAAILSGADLSGAYLRHTVLCGAPMSEASLSNANLRRAIVTDEQLADARSLQGATMPSRPRTTCEEWLSW